MKNQQIHQLFIRFINYVWYLLHVSALHCHLQGEFLVPSERCSIEEQSIEYCVWAWRYLIATHHVTRHNKPIHNILSTAPLIDHLSEGTRNAPCGWQCIAETCRSHHT